MNKKPPQRKYPNAPRPIGMSPIGRPTPQNPLPPNGSTILWGMIILGLTALALSQGQLIKKIFFAGGGVEFEQKSQPSQSPTVKPPSPEIKKTGSKTPFPPPPIQSSPQKNIDDSANRPLETDKPAPKPSAYSRESDSMPIKPPARSPRPETYLTQEEPQIDWGNFQNFFNVESYEFKLDTRKTPSPMYLVFVIEAKAAISMSSWFTVNFYDSQGVKSNNAVPIFNPPLFPSYAGQRHRATILIPPSTSRVEIIEMLSYRRE